MGGRTPLSWLLITIFYIIYYAFLAGFWALMLIIFFQFIEEGRPRWDYSQGSLIGSSLIFNKNKMKDGRTIPGYAQWVGRTDKFLEESGYKTTHANESVTRKEELTILEDCNGVEDKDYGYSSGNPCVFLKLNKIYGLEPEYTTDDPDMPQELKDRIAAATDTKQVWVSCKGENAADAEKMGEIEYFPKDGGFPARKFPYMNEPDYLSPLIAVRFRNPQVGTLLHIECRAWAGNIKYHRRDRVGIAHFELMIHQDGTAKKVDGTLAKN